MVKQILRWEIINYGSDWRDVRVMVWSKAGQEKRDEFKSLSTIHKAWNLFKFFEQSPENSTEKSWFSTFDRSKIPFDRSSDLFNWSNRNRAAIETFRDSRFFLYHFNWSSQSFNRSKMLNFKFSLRKFQNLNSHFNNFMKQYSPNSDIIITTYPYIYLYIQQKVL